METFNQDPKPGRLILPLVLIGMIATTYTFINRVAENNELEIIEAQPVEEVQEVVDDDTTTTSTTSTTLPSAYVEYLEEIPAEKIEEAASGHDFNLDEISPNFRYLKFSIRSNYGSDSLTHGSEISIFGRDNL